MIKVNQHLESKQMITTDLYKGSIIEKAYQGGDESIISAEIIKTQLNNKLEKGIIDQPLYDKAIEQLEANSMSQSPATITYVFHDNMEPWAIIKAIHTPTLSFGDSPDNPDQESNKE